MSVAQRSITSIAWNSIASWGARALLLARTIVLARWLPVEVFGIHALAGSVMGLASIVAHFGMAHAFLHRAPETEDEEQAAAVYFTLKLIAAFASITLLSLGALVLTSGLLRTALVVLAITDGMLQVTSVPSQILARRIVYRRLALLKLSQAALASVLALVLGWQGEALWALLSIDICNAALAVVGLYVWKPVWRPRLSWNPKVVRYFVSYGSRSLLADVLNRALDRVDDLWVGRYLGETSLGFYSRAYAFATYPRQILAGPLYDVAVGTYAELKAKRRQLSQAFFRVNAALIRSGFFVGGLFALIAPEVVRLLLGDKWLPMLNVFRLMLVFTLLDPIKMTTGYLFVTAGKPEKLTGVQLAQMAVLAIGLYSMGSRWGVVGVALAVDLMLVVGIGLLLRHAREFVDLSVRRLFFSPSIALASGLIVSRAALYLPRVLGTDWRTAGVKALSFTVIYVGTLVLLEGRHILEVIEYLGVLRRVRLLLRSEGMLDGNALGRFLKRAGRPLYLKARGSWELWQWKQKGRPVPPPHIVKERTVKMYAKRFSLSTLIETGTYNGAMVYSVRKMFRRIYTIELDGALFAEAQKKFASMPHVTVLQGDSSQVLPELLSEIDSPCLFWLDAHYSGQGTAKADLETPIVQEVRSILGHAVKGHVLLIDDARCFDGRNGYPEQDELEALVSAMRPDWGFEVEADIIRICGGEL